MRLAVIEIFKSTSNFPGYEGTKQWMLPTAKRFAQVECLSNAVFDITWKQAQTRKKERKIFEDSIPRNDPSRDDMITQMLSELEVPIHDILPFMLKQDVIKLDHIHVGTM